MASGLAAYFNIDTTAVRIIFVVLALMSLGWGIIIYLILLIAMPEAKSKAQLLEMQGIEPTLENIDNFHQEPVDHSATTSTFGRILKVCFIVLGTIVGVSLAIAALGIFLAMFVALLLHDPDIFGNPLNMGLLGSCALFLLCPAIGIAVLCSRAANGVRRHKWVGWTLLAIWILSLFGIVGFGIEMSKRDDIGRQLEHTSQQWERLFESNDLVSSDSYYGTKELDSIIEPVLDELRDDSTTYDITIRTNPDKGVNLNISTRQKTVQPADTSKSPSKPL